MTDEQQSPGFSSSMAREIDELLNDSLFNPRVAGQNDVAGAVSDSAAASSIGGTTPDPLNTAFIDEETISVRSQHSQISLSQQQSQTTRETSSTIHRLIGTIIEQEEHHPIIDLCTPTKAMQSTGTMPQTPTMISRGTMPQTPTMISRGTMPTTPTMISRGTMPQTPIMISRGTMPKTPTTISTSTMPTTPTMISTGTMPTITTITPMGIMPRTPTPASASTAANETIDLRSPSTPSTIDLRSPAAQVIQLSSPGTPTNAGRSNNSPRH